METIKIEIKHRWMGIVMYEYSSVDNTLSKTVIEALKSGADLCGADLCDASLRGANLRGADLCRANLRGAKGCYMSCPSDGSFIGWKNAENMIVKLHIPEDAQRSSAGGIKCRCNKAIVLEIQNIDGTISAKQTVHSTHDPNFAYTVGAMVEVTDFDHNRWNECAPGIHFFIDRLAAVEY